MKHKLDKIRLDLNAALIEVGAMNGVKFKVGNMRYTSESVKITLDAFDTNGAGADTSVDQLAWNKGCAWFGFKEEDFGKKFSAGTRTFTISGLKPKNHKYPIIGSGPEGGRYKFEADRVLRGLKSA